MHAPPPHPPSVAPRLLAATVAALLAWACRLPQSPPPGATGMRIYELQLCANCHGDDGGGTWRGPALRELGRIWTRDQLVDFLGDVEGWEARDERIRRLSREHRGDMRDYDHLSVDERGRLADWLLGL